MVGSVTKKVRLSRPVAAKLRRLARQRRVPESVILREGIELVERMDRRSQAVEELIAMIEGPEPKKINFGLR